ncbi:MAG TPA: 16S rRNA (guanine(966)-N(2))-methyltransferase RsmD [Hydrogenophaga sp.]|uniref:16S rRNA (guanine(966)-N(2))-methyltransferase RsmD n=1 Tax=Hydrogenophaga sp. TaxID=1904254 RepID=UPI002C19140A|nr:16S rRNA (guanine(966)-N(2))-methyltransferase RsmD [Hydrogenophaga sp.]HMN94704.1 16S rRNA (guanine(966)-N(2))-methyltransferase RsmD [Hydrogenophaga sp.]HMP08916.1 16S rRNA (guanine(966)-N(2))-methyltransferase RsmD [Hydrogenophaga sp.]
MKKPATRPAAKATHEVRIIGGRFKRSRLPVASRPGLRPTPSRVRETLFNWLGQDLSGWRCFDAFAGTGALGFEAASRGAAQVWLAEQDPSLVTGLQSVRQRLQAEAVEVLKGDGVSLLQQRRDLDLVFLDPPFGDGGNDALFAAALRAARAALKPDGFVYLESPRPWSAEELAALGLQAWRQDRAGAVSFALLRVLPGA